MVSAPVPVTVTRWAGSMTAKTSAVPAGSDTAAPAFEDSRMTERVSVPGEPPS